MESRFTPVTFIKTPVAIDVVGRIAAVEHVIGVHGSHQPTYWEHGYNQNEQETQEVLPLPALVADRLIDFFRWCRTPAPEYRAYHNCHLFVWYILGLAQELRPYDVFDCEQDTGVLLNTTTKLRSGRPYGILADNGLVSHSLIGTARPSFGLSIMGDGSPLAIAPLTELMHLYQGIGVLSMTPKQLRGETIHAEEIV